MPYRAARNGLPYGDPMGYAKTLSYLADKAATWGPRYRVKPSINDDWSRELTRPEMLLKAGAAMKRAAWGALIKVEVGTERGLPAVFLVKKTMPAEPLRYYTGAIVDLSDGNDRIAEVGEYAKMKVPRVQCSGFVYTRKVAGTSIWSQHSNFATGGNAIDLTCYVGDNHTKGIDMDATEDVADVLVAAARAGHLQLQRVIIANRQYSYPGFAATPYSGQYHTHTHAECRPTQGGTPVDA